MSVKPISTENLPKTSTSATAINAALAIKAARVWLEQHYRDGNGHEQENFFDAEGITLSQNRCPKTGARKNHLIAINTFDRH